MSAASKFLPTGMVLLAIVLLSGCTDVRTQGETARRSGYTPLDPIPVKFIPNGETDLEKKHSILKMLPDSTMRLAIVETDADAKVSYGVASASLKNHNYDVVLDYIQFTTKSFALKKKIEFAPPTRNVKVEKGRVTFETIRNLQDADVHVPVYIGVGVRLTAHVHVNEEGVDLGSLVALGALHRQNKSAAHS
jgi:hypothetical protein